MGDGCPVGAKRKCCSWRIDEEGKYLIIILLVRLCSLSCTSSFVGTRVEPSRLIFIFPTRLLGVIEVAAKAFILHAVVRVEKCGKYIAVVPPGICSVHCGPLAVAGHLVLGRRAFVIWGERGLLAERIPLRHCALQDQAASSC